MYYGIIVTCTQSRLDRNLTGLIWLQYVLPTRLLFPIFNLDCLAIKSVAWCSTTELKNLPHYIFSFEIMLSAMIRHNFEMFVH